MKKQTKTGTDKKSPAKKVSGIPKREKGTHNRQKDELIKHLKIMIKDLNEEGLKFLIQQAEIILHNMQVKKQVKKLQNKEYIKDEAKKGPVSTKLTIEVKEGEDNSYFVIVINKARNFFALDEMRKLVKICHLSKDKKDASRRLHNWLSKNRKDVLIDTDIRGTADPALDTIYNFLKSNYTLKGDE
ncbi:MAG: hypothetical protein SVZ03_08615 [Spirochaetota bacterium]|nr:hypothetical protein [Spirochaetota bacterium]